MNLWQNYVQPKSIPEAVRSLREASRPLAIVAGGTDLIIDLKQGRHPPVNTLLDVTRIPEMLCVEKRGENLFIGAVVPINCIAGNSLVFQNARGLVDACDLIAGPQVRNVATLGGNVAHALPAADGTIALLALDTLAEIQDARGARQVPLAEFFVSPGKSILQEEEILTGFFLPLRSEGQASGFRRIMRPQGVALPILNCSVWLERQGEKIVDIRIAIGPGGSTPFRAMEMENLIRGKQFSDDLFVAAANALLREAQFRTSPRRASREYRRHISMGLFRDTFLAAWERAGQAG